MRPSSHCTLARCPALLGDASVSVPVPAAVVVVAAALKDRVDQRQEPGEGELQAWLEEEHEGTTEAESLEVLS